jgi:hypothetical protein
MQIRYKHAGSASVALRTTSHPFHLVREMYEYLTDLGSFMVMLCVQVSHQVPLRLGEELLGIGQSAHYGRSS